METRANYVLIGGFALAGFIGLLGLLFWFAQVELDRQFAYYDIDFQSVSGLGDASDVRFAGLPVGRVVDVRLSPENDGRVRVRIEVDASTPVRSNSIATIEAQGVTGVSFVGISAGTPDAELLADASEAEVPMIRAGRSVLQSLSREAPQILTETLKVVRQLHELIGGENQRRVSNILENIERSSAAFAGTLDDFSAVSSAVSDFAREIVRFNTMLDGLSADMSGVLKGAQTTLASIDALSGDARATMASSTETLRQTQSAVAAAERYINNDLGPVTQQLSSSVAALDNRLTTLTEGASGLISTYTETGQTATARLNEAREVLSEASRLISRLDRTAQGIDGLVREEAKPLVDELRVAAREVTDHGARDQRHHPNRSKSHLRGDPHRERGDDSHHQDRGE